MRVEQEPSPLVLQGVEGRFRGKWVDAEVFGREGRDEGTRCLLFSDDYHDPFRPGRNGEVHVVAMPGPEGGFRLACRVAFPRFSPESANSSEGAEDRQIQLSGHFSAIGQLVGKMETLLAPGRPEGSAGKVLPEPEFWLAPLPGFPGPAGVLPPLPAVKTYRRRRSDLRERARHFSDRWVELDPELLPRISGGVVAAFSVVSDRGSFSGEVWIEKKETSFSLRAEARTGDSLVDLRETGQDLEVLRGRGFRWASSLSLMGKRIVSAPR